MLRLQTILHPTDFSERSRVAFELACSLARDHGARLLVVYVLSPIVYGELASWQQGDDYYEELRNNLRQLQPPDSTVHVEYRLEEGEIVTEILRVAQETKSDLIVLGTHGRTGLVRLLMGSVAEQVLRKASCPVLTVRATLPGTAAALPAQSSAALTS
jgi:nucleotide-binding universal stress UspA family protein